MYNIMICVSSRYIYQSSKINLWKTKQLDFAKQLEDYKDFIRVFNYLLI